MSIEQGLRKRIEQLISEGMRLAVGHPEWGNCRDEAHASACGAWTTAATHAVHLTCPSPNNSYNKAATRFETTPRDGAINNRVGEFAGLLKRLLVDVDDGLLTSVANEARGETLDDLLDQAAEYLKRERLDGSGILAGAVFEDTLRRICKSNDIDDKGVKTDALITELNKREIISNTVAKRCRAAAGLRNSALPNGMNLRAVMSRPHWPSPANLSQSTLRRRSAVHRRRASVLGTWGRGAGSGSSFANASRIDRGRSR